MYPGADNTELKEYFAARPLLASVMFFVLAVLYALGAIYGFSLRNPFLAWGAVLAAVIHFVESMRRLSQVPRRSDE